MADYFGGWYFKCQTGDRTLAVIPAVHRTKGRQTYSIQLITDDGNWNVPFSEGRLRPGGRLPDAKIGDNRFTDAGMRLNLHTDRLSAVGSVRFRGLSPIQYDIMGPFRYVPFMECRHSVISMRHAVDGTICINGEEYCFQEGTGYIEGDRGRSFPTQYAWTQCCFDGGALMASVAEIPLGLMHFTGVISVVRWKGREYRLATYLGGTVKRARDGEVVIAQRDMLLTARLLEEASHPLLAPTGGAMTRTIRESAACRAFYRFEKAGSTLFAFETSRASFEFEFGNQD